MAESSPEAAQEGMKAWMEWAGRAGDGIVLKGETSDEITAVERLEGRTLFAAGVPVVGVCAAGILIRAVAPLLSDKRAEPPVLAAASKPVERTVMTLIGSFDCTVASALPA